MTTKFKPYFKATIKKSKGKRDMVWDAGEEENVKRWLGSLQYKSVDTKIKVTLERYRNDASLQQKRYLFGVVYVVIGDHIGVDIYEYEKEIHIPMKKMFLGYKSIEEKVTYKIFEKPLKKVTGSIVELVSIKELDTKQMTDFIENIRRWGREVLGVTIPAPNDADLDDLPDVTNDF